MVCFLNEMETLHGMKNQYIGQQAAGAMAAMIGVVAITQWAVFYNSFEVWVPGTEYMGLSTPMLLVAAGVCCALLPVRRQKKPLFNFLIPGCIGFLFLWPALVLSQHVFGISLGIDFTRGVDLPTPSRPFPGRMAPNTCVSFLLIGCTLRLAIQPARSNRQRWFMATSVAGLLLLALSALAGHFLGIEKLYRLASSNYMLLPTSIGLSLVGIALWFMLQALNERDQILPQNRQPSITRRSLAILTLTAISAGVIGFGIMREGFERTLADNILLTAKTNATSLVNTLEASAWYPRTMASRPEVREAMLKLNRDIEDSKAREILRAVGASFLNANITGVKFISSKGTLILSAGQFLRETATVAHHIEQQTANTFLLWRDGYLLYTENPVIDNGETIGQLVVEQRLPAFDKLLNDIRSNSPSTDALVCDRVEDNAICSPSRFYRTPLKIPMYTTDGAVNLPINRALLGQIGAMVTKDLRGITVIAGYTPLKNYGMGIVVKADIETLYAPLKERVNALGIALGLLILFGTLASRMQVRPLIDHIVREERSTKIILENSNDAFIALDVEGRITDWNMQAERTFGWTASEAIGGKLAAMIIPPEQRAAHEAGFARFMRSAQGPVINQRIEVNAIHRNGTVIPIELSIAAFHNGHGHVANAFLRDISTRKLAEQALYAEKERLQVTLQSIGDAVITTDTDEQIVFMNPVAEAMTGWPSEEAIGQPLTKIFYIINEQTNARAFDRVKAVLKSQKAAGLAEQTALVHRDGRRFPIEDSAAPIRDQSGAIIGVVLVFHDVSEARKMAAEMTHQATHDALTGLINRSEFERRMETALTTGKVQHKEHTLLYMDLDQFKIVNDTCGHVAGDELLKQLSSLLQDKLRQSDTLARLGGDEFGVLLEGCPQEPAMRIADTLRKTVSDFRFAWEGKSFPIGVSIGLVTFSNGGITLADVLRMADAACYLAKDKGRNRIHVYADEDEELVRRQGEMSWTTRINQALGENRLVLYAQKILCINEVDPGREHYEVLVRMLDDRGHLIPPMAFIPAAERYGLMPLIDCWVIRNAFACFAQRHAASTQKVTCAINLSGATICDEQILHFIHQEIQRLRIPAASICFEVTETAAITNLKQAVALIRELKKLGCQFALDDFGSGMSSFAYLKHLPVDYLKIDGSFVKDMVDGPIDCAMVEAINHIGHVMGIQTIAEFVENDAILDKLRTIGVDYAQGYGIGKPVPFLNKQYACASGS